MEKQTIYTIPNTVIRNEVMTMILENANGSWRDLVEEGWDAAINSLEKKENIYPLTQEQLDKIRADAFDAGFKNGYDADMGWNEIQSAEQYLKSLNP